MLLVPDFGFDQQWQVPEPSQEVPAEVVDGAAIPTKLKTSPESIELTEDPLPLTSLKLFFELVTSYW